MFFAVVGVLLSYLKEPENARSEAGVALHHIRQQQAARAILMFQAALRQSRSATIGRPRAQSRARRC
jgi:hypothetical protein